MRNGQRILRRGAEGGKALHARHPEIEISLFARQCLARPRIPTLAKLQSEAAAWNTRVNHDRVKINWQFTRRMARQKFRYKPSSTNLFMGSQT
jgi:hypothetical protein